MATNNVINLGQFTKGITNIKNYTDEKTRGLHFEEEVLRIPAETIQEAYDNRTNENSIKIPIGLDEEPNADVLDDLLADEGISSHVRYRISFMDEECEGYHTFTQTIEGVCNTDSSIQIFYIDPIEYGRYTYLNITDNFKTKEITDLVLTLVKDIDFSDAFDISEKGIILNNAQCNINYDSYNYNSRDIVNRGYLKYCNDELEKHSTFKSAIASAQANSIYNSSQVICEFESTNKSNTYCSISADYSDSNNKVKEQFGYYSTRPSKYRDNKIKINDKINIVLNYYSGGLKTDIYTSKVDNITGKIYSKTIKLDDEYNVLLEVFVDKYLKYNNDKTDILIEDDKYRTCFKITFDDDIPINKINSLLEDLDIYIEVCRLNTLTLDNEEEYVPTENYNPATKKYVDDAVQNVSSGEVDQLTDEELINALSESDYLIPINVEITSDGIPYFMNRVDIIDKNENNIYIEDVSHWYYPHINEDIYITQSIMDNGLKINIRHEPNDAYDYLETIKMDNVTLTKNEDYEYEKTDELISITLTKVTGNIYIKFNYPTSN